MQEKKHAQGQSRIWQVDQGGVCYGITDLIQLQVYAGVQYETLYRNMNIYEEEVVEKWFYTYKYNLEIIEIALKKSIGKSNATLATFDAIITSWYKNGFSTVDEILNYEEQRRSAYAAAKKQSASDTPKTVAEQKNNFVQRRYDEDYLNSFIVSEEDTQWL